MARTEQSLLAAAAMAAMAASFAGCVAGGPMSAAGGWDNACAQDWVDGAEFSESHGFWRYHADSEIVGACLGRSRALANRRGDDGETPLHMAALNSTGADVLETLVRHGAETDARTGRGETPLHWAVGKGRSHVYDPAIIEVLLDNGADVNARDRDGNTPLHLASFDKDPGIVGVLLRHGADTGARNGDGDTPLLLAARGGRSLKVVELLLRNGAAVDARNNSGDTALLVAARVGPSRGVMGILIRHGADEEARDDSGATPLVLAARRGNLMADELRDALAERDSEEPDAAGDYRRGARALDAGDYETALGEFLPLVGRGDSRAQFSLGMMYERGLGVVRSDVDAVFWYRQAAGQGHPGAQYSLGTMKADGRGVPQNHRAALVWFSIAAENGLEEARAASTRARSLLSAGQVEEAERSARKCVESRYSDCL